MFAAFGEDRLEYVDGTTTSVKLAEWKTSEKPGRRISNSALNFQFGLVFGSDFAFSSKILPKTFFGLKFLLKNVFGPNF